MLVEASLVGVTKSLRTCARFNLLFFVDLPIHGAANLAAIGSQVRFRNRGVGEAGCLLGLPGFLFFGGMLMGVFCAVEFRLERTGTIEGALLMDQVVNSLGERR